MSATIADPSLEALKHLDEPGKFIVRRAVPIFCEHTDPITGEKVGRAKLETLARNTNRREQEEGVPMGIVIGHTPGRKEEEIQHVGYARNHRVAKFGPKQKLGIVSDFYYKPECYEKAKQYPHRSIERWVDDEIMDPVSLLARTPQLDLGLLLPDDGHPVQKKLAVNDGCELMVYARGGVRRVYQMSEESPCMDLTEFLDGLETLIQRARATCGGGEGGEPMTNPEPQPQTYEASPSGTNTAMPELLTYSKEQYEALKAERDAFKVKAEEAQIKADEAQRLYQKQAREKTLTALKNEGVDVDVAAELADTEALDDAAFEKHTAKVKKCYRRTARPAAGFIETEQPPAPEMSVDETEYEKYRPLVREYQRKHKCDTLYAYQMVKAGKE